MLANFARYKYIHTRFRNDGNDEGWPPEQPKTYVPLVLICNAKTDCHEPSKENVMTETIASIF